MGFVLGAMFAYIAGSPFILQNIYGASPQMFSLFFAINSIGIIAASQITGRLAKRISGDRLLASGIGLAAVSSVILLIAIMARAPLPVFLVPLFFVVSSVGLVASTSYSLALQNQGKTAGTASAVLGVMTFMVGGIAAPLVEIAGSATAVPMGIIIVIGDDESQKVARKRGSSYMRFFLNKSCRQYHENVNMVMKLCGASGFFVGKAERASQNHSGVPRFMCNRTTPLKERMQLQRDNTNDYSPLELSVRSALNQKIMQ